MSFMCENCGLHKNEKPNKQVTKRRRKAYPARTDWKGKKDDGGIGWERVKEITICDTCKGVL